MDDTSKNKPKKYICAALLAHVDAGKTTLSEALLYKSGSISNAGRVDKKDTFLDTDAQERERGITIFSKQAVFDLGDVKVTLLDTPGHMDFSAEMERTLQVLDCAVLVISGTDGVQGHTVTLWKLLKKYHIPAYLFINKMDQEGTDRERLMQELKDRLSDGCIDFTEDESPEFYEQVALTDEAVLEQYLSEGTIEEGEIQKLIQKRKIFPCFFGSALRFTGIQEFMNKLGKYLVSPPYTKEFSARVYKITRDSQGNRLTHMKITGGALWMKMVLPGVGEKVNQIRIYSGEKYQARERAEAGMICAIPGLTGTNPGMGLGEEKELFLPVLEPVLTYCIAPKDDTDKRVLYRKLKELQEEDPMLRILWEEALQEIEIQLMGEVQLEVVQNLIRERFGIEASFGAGRIVYKETITDVSEGIGHFEPLRHYAEVHLLLEPGERGSGVHFGADVSEDELDRNWQRLILTHLQEKEHRGILTGAPITDVKITLIAGRAHNKHTEGGDFRQATYRAVRHGLKRAQSVLLEPYYQFLAEVPTEMLGRLMTDIERMHGTFDLPGQEGEMAVLSGSVPVTSMQGYHKELIAYTRGTGQLFCTMKGYFPCHNAEEVIAETAYDSERDIENPTGSIFCAHGTGIVVPWEQVEQYMHIEKRYVDPGRRQEETEHQNVSLKEEERWIGTEEIDAILERTYQSNAKEKNTKRKKYKPRREALTVSAGGGIYKPQEILEEYLLVDGYNVIFAWEDLKELAMRDIDAARGRLMDHLCNYQAIRGCKLILVFDAYRVERHTVEMMSYYNIYVVFTAEAETADQYIEKFAYQNKHKYRVTVATSDYMEQIITRGQGCGLISARELLTELQEANERIRKEYADKQPGSKNYLFDLIEKGNGGKLYGSAGNTSEDD